MQRQYSSEQLLKLSTRKKLIGWRGVRDRRKRLKMLRIQSDRGRAVAAVDRAVAGIGNAAEAAGIMLEKKTVGKPYLESGGIPVPNFAGQGGFRVEAGKIRDKLVSVQALNDLIATLKPGSKIIINNNTFEIVAGKEGKTLKRV